MRKSHFFETTRINFFHIFCKNRTFLFIYLKSWFWIPVLATETAIIFCIWIFYFRKNKMKVSFGYEKKQFFGDKYGNCWQKLFFCELAIKTYEILRKQQFYREQRRSKSSAQTPRSLHFLGYVLHIYTFPMSDFLRKCPAGEQFWGNCCDNRTKIKHKKQNFCRKMLQKSYFLKNNCF